jgi:nucleotide-binding universal stress UspA family protein
MAGYVAAIPQIQADIAAAARENLERLLTDDDRVRLKAEAVVLTGDGPARAITEYAHENAIDLIVVGTHGRRGLSHLVMGSVAERIVRTAECPVLTVRRATAASVTRERDAVTAHAR